MQSIRGKSIGGIKGIRSITGIRGIGSISGIRGRGIRGIRGMRGMRGIRAIWEASGRHLGASGSIQGHLEASGGILEAL